MEATVRAELRGGRNLPLAAFCVDMGDKMEASWLVGT